MHVRVTRTSVRLYKVQKYIFYCRIHFQTCMISIIPNSSFTDPDSSFVKIKHRATFIKCARLTARTW